MADYDRYVTNSEQESIRHFPHTNIWLALTMVQLKTCFISGKGSANLYKVKNMSANEKQDSICPIHNVEKVCLKCVAAKGGRNRAKNYSIKQIREWGKMGPEAQKKGKRH